jgi:hypothetical protein
LAAPFLVLRYLAWHRILLSIIYGYTRYEARYTPKFLTRRRMRDPEGPKEEKK